MVESIDAGKIVGRAKPLSILVAVLENRDSVKIPFWGSYNGIRHIKGTMVEEKLFPGPDLVGMRTDAVVHALKHGHDRILMLDSDMVYRPETLTMLETAGVDVICGFSLDRGAPYRPNWFVAPKTRVNDPYAFDRAWPTNTGDAAGEPLHGPQRAYVVGGAALYVRTDVFRRVPRPWFQFEWKELSDGTRTRVGEDAWFSYQCRRAGVKLYCHVDLLIGHLVTMPVVPEYDVNRKEWRSKYVPVLSRDAAEQLAREKATAAILDDEARANERDHQEIREALATVNVTAAKAVAEKSPGPRELARSEPLPLLGN